METPVGRTMLFGKIVYFRGRDKRKGNRLRSDQSGTKNDGWSYSMKVYTLPHDGIVITACDLLEYYVLTLK